MFTFSKTEVSALICFCCSAAVTPCFATVASSHDAQLAGDRHMTNVTYRIRRRDGAYSWCETVTWAMREPDTGDIRELRAVTRDVSGRMQVSQHAPVGMATLNLDGQYVQVNEQLIRSRAIRL